MLVNKLNEMRNQTDEEGFTLIELMIVVVIIGILAAIAIPIFANQQKEGHKAAVKSDVRNTVGNIATFLAQDPDAADVSAADKVVTGDDIINVSGTWDNYVVKGKTNNVEGWCLVYTSSAGKYVEATGTDCDFTSTTGGGPVGGEGPADEEPPFTPVTLTEVKFETAGNLEGYSNMGQPGTNLSISTTQKYSGNSSLYLNSSNSGTLPFMQKGFTGFIEDKTYRFTAWVYLNEGDRVYAVVAADGQPTSSKVSTKNTWTQISVDWVAEGSAQSVQIRVDKASGSSWPARVYLDDVKVEQIS